MVSITWSASAGGATITSVNHGSAANGANTSAQQIYLRHDGDNAITGCGFYFVQKAGAYTGDFNAPTDLAEITAWGDEDSSSGFGGIQINMNAEGTFDGGATWDMDESTKTSPDGLKFTMRTGTGNSAANAVTLSETMSASMSENGTIPSSINDVTFQIRIKVPTDEDTPGVRQFDQVLKFVFTS
jgi:hypothetical protein